METASLFLCVAALTGGIHYDGMKIKEGCLDGVLVKTPVCITEKDRLD